jgi:predicted RNase H-like nuclease (RuvC/YqgF family)
METLFLDALQLADHYEIRSGVLILSGQGKYLMEFASDPGQKEVTNASSNYKLSNFSSKESELTVTKTSNSSTSTTSNEVDELQKQLEELQKQLAAKKQKEAEEQKLKEEKQKQEEAQKSRVEQEKQKKLKEIEELKRQLAEKEKETNTESPSKSATKISTTSDKPTVSTAIPQPDEYDILYYLENNTLREMERSAVSLKLEKNNHITFEAKNMESPCQLKERNLPRIILKIRSGETPSELFTLLTVETTKNSRIIATGKIIGGKTQRYQQIDHRH